MEFRLPDFQLIIDIHKIILESYGGLEGVPHPEFIESVIARPQNHMSYSSNGDIHLIAALILEGLARNHAFADGNKRTALIAMLMTYNLNNINLEYSLSTNNKFEALVLDVVENKPSIQKIRTQLKKLIKEFQKID